MGISREWGGGPGRMGVLWCRVRWSGKGVGWEKSVVGWGVKVRTLLKYVSPFSDPTRCPHTH